MAALISANFSPFQIGIASIVFLVLLILARIPVAAALFATGLLGTWLIDENLRMINSQMKSFTFGIFTNYSFSIIPLFLLMSEFASRSGMSSALFRAAESWLGHRKGGLAIAAIAASGGFGAISGSSVATASSIGKIALSELKKSGYSSSLATGALAAGGTLGILIPPSVVLVIYAIIAEENITKLFTAAFIPGLLAMLGYMLTVIIYVKFVPSAVTVKPRIGYSERFLLLKPVIPLLMIFLLVIGGIYSGGFSPTSAAAVGAACTFILACAQKKMNKEMLHASLLATGKTSVMIFLIILGAAVYNSFLSASQVPQEMAQWLSQKDINAWLVVLSMLAMYIVLGTVMDSLAMIFLTVPIFLPIVSGLDLGIPPAEIGIWFGILVLVAAEVGLITPPVGLNLFVINAIDKKININETYRGVMPFVLSDIIRLGLLLAFPALSLFFVRLFYG